MSPESNSKSIPTESSTPSTSTTTSAPTSPPETPLATLFYTPTPVECGYTDQVLHIDVSPDAYRIESRAVDPQTKHLFVGGKGYGLWLLWSALADHSPPEDWPAPVPWDDPVNTLCISSGPIGGVTTFPGAGKSIAVGLSPLTGSVADSNAGGYFGPYLKFAGFDAIAVRGCSDQECIIIVDGIAGKITVLSAAALPSASYPLVEHLHERFGDGDPGSIAVISAGPGAEHTRFGCLNFSWYDAARGLVRMKQAGRGGLGTVLRQKRIKALVVRAPKPTPASIHADDPAAVRKIGLAAIREVKALDPLQAQMAVYGTTGGVATLNDADLLPVRNYQVGTDPATERITGDVFKKRFDAGFDGCWKGCAVSCSHGVRDFELQTGPDKGKHVFVDGPEYETIACTGSNCGIFDPDHIIEMNYYCDNYGVDTISVGTTTAFLMECYERGWLTAAATGGLELTFGNGAAALELLHRMARGEGFGKIAGMGVRRLKAVLCEEYGAPRSIIDAIAMEAKGLEYSGFVTKEAQVQSAGYGLALKGAQHDEMSVAYPDAILHTWPTRELMAEALFWLPLWRTWFSLVGLCKLPWNTVKPEGNAATDEPWKVMEHVETYARLLTAVTGRQTSADGLLFQSERVYNFQRMLALRLGYGTRKHDRVPYRSLGPVLEDEYDARADRYDAQLENIGGLDVAAMSTAEKLTKLREVRQTRYERLCDRVYEKRGWTHDGVPTLRKLRSLGLRFRALLELAERFQ